MAGGELIHGPYLRLDSFWPEDQKWIASVLVVASRHAVPNQPRLLVKDGEQQPSFPGSLLESHEDYNFWRFNIDTVLLGTERPVHFFADLGPEASAGQRWHTVTLPAAGQPWHWAFTSSAAFSSGRAPPPEWGGAAPTWWSLMRSHGQRPLHALLRGGGQINGDKIFEEPPIAQWTQGANRQEREHAPFTQDMGRAAAAAYFKAYTSAFGGEGVRDALATIPQVQNWDDEDVFTLFGSFPPGMQRCPVFKGLFEVARRFYLLFQHHTTAVDADRRRTFLSATNLSHIKQLGPFTVVIAVDVRSERSREVVLEPSSWSELFHRAGGIPRGVRHAIVMLPPPLNYPRVPLGDRAAHASSSLVQYDKNRNLARLLSSAGMGPAAPHLDQSWDEAIDRWASTAHRQERRRVVEQLQALAGERDMRITILCGGTGAAGVAQFYSWPKEPDVKRDQRWMAQLVAPPLVDKPATETAVRALQLVSVASQGVNNLTKEKMVRLFGYAHPALAKLLPRRGWIEAVELPPGSYVPQYQVRPAQRRPRGAPPQPEGIAGKASAMLGRTSSLLKKTYREARGETVIDDEDKVIVLPPTPGCLTFTFHLEPAPGRTSEMECFDYVVPSFANQLPRVPSSAPPASAAAGGFPSSQHAGQPVDAAIGGTTAGAAAAAAQQQPGKPASPAASATLQQQQQSPPPSGQSPASSNPAAAQYQAHQQQRPAAPHQPPAPQHVTQPVPFTYAEVGGSSTPQQPQVRPAAAAVQPPSQQQQQQQPTRRPLSSIPPLSGVEARGPPVNAEKPGFRASGSVFAGGTQDRPQCIPVASDPFGVAAVGTPPSGGDGQQSQQGLGQPGAGHHSLEQAPSDDPFAPGAGGHPGGSASGIFGAQDMPHRRPASSAEQYAAPVWQPAYGNRQQQQNQPHYPPVHPQQPQAQAQQHQQQPQQPHAQGQNPPPMHLQQQDSASTDDSFSFPKMSREASGQNGSASDFSFAKPQGVSEGYRQAYSNYLAGSGGSQQSRPPPSSVSPVRVVPAPGGGVVGVQPISGGMGGGPPVAAPGCRITAGQQAASRPQAPQPATTGHGSVPTQAYNRPMPTQPASLSQSGAQAGTGSSVSSSPFGAAALQANASTAHDSRAGNAPNTSATMAFLANLRTEDQDTT